jgi:DNA-directed RNA polymerase subunit RPC12/RpoP
MYNEKTADINSKLQCKNCAAPVAFQPGTQGTACGYCGTYNPIAVSAEDKHTAAREFSFNNYREIDDSQKLTVQVLKCNSCGAAASYSNNTSATNCAFCASPLVVTGGTTASVIKPKAMIPFVVAQPRALEEFRKYAKKQFFAPNDFRNMTKHTENLFGMYIPYWTYDALVKTNYEGEQGIDYQTTETYTTVEGGKNVTRTRTVTKTRWYDVSGIVANEFDDITVIATKSLPTKQANSLNPWNYKALVPYNDAYIAGFNAEMYNINIEQGLTDAYELMKPEIEQSIRNDIGGDHQRIDTYNSQKYNVSFRHILLPIWINTYKYKDKTYHFLINGQTGEVQGSQPISVAKILGVVFAVLAVIVLFALAVGGKK